MPSTCFDTSRHSSTCFPQVMCVFSTCFDIFRHDSHVHRTHQQRTVSGSAVHRAHHPRTTRARKKGPRQPKPAGANTNAFCDTSDGEGAFSALYTMWRNAEDSNLGDLTAHSVSNRAQSASLPAFRGARVLSGGGRSPSGGAGARGQSRPCRHKYSTAHAKPSPSASAPSPTAMPPITCFIAYDLGSKS